MLVIHNPLLFKIDLRRECIKNLLDMYPAMMEEFNRLLHDRFKKEARDAAKGDSELEFSILSSMETDFDNDGFIIDEFYKSILLVCFSYYESTLQIIDKDLTPSSINSIALKKKITLSATLKDETKFLDKSAKHFRNGISHNDAGTLKDSQIQAIKEIGGQFKDISYNSGTKEVVFLGPSFLYNLLNKVHLVLRELAISFGHSEMITIG